MERDLGFLDKRESALITHLKSTAEETTELKLLGYLLRATRRDEVSDATGRAITKLSVQKQVRMENLAHKYLMPFDYKNYKKKTAAWFKRPTTLMSLTMKLPFGKLRCVQRQTVESLRHAI